MELVKKNNKNNLKSPVLKTSQLRILKKILL